MTEKREHLCETKKKSIAEQFLKCESMNANKTKNSRIMF